MTGPNAFLKHLAAIALSALSCAGSAAESQSYCEIPQLQPGVPYTISSEDIRDPSIACGAVAMDGRIVRVNEPEVVRYVTPIAPALEDGRQICQRTVYLRLIGGDANYIVRLIEPRETSRGNRC